METEWLGLPLQPGPAIPAAARRAVCGFLAARGIDHDVTHDAALVVSELVTNALLHGALPVALGVGLSDGFVRIAVSDADPGGQLTVLPAGPDDAHGRGLGIVESVAESWGSVHHPRDGKTVWADVPDRRTGTPR